MEIFFLVMCEKIIKKNKEMKNKILKFSGKKSSKKSKRFFFYFHKTECWRLKAFLKHQKGRKDGKKIEVPTVAHPLISWRLLCWLLSWCGSEHISEWIAQLQKVIERILLLLWRSLIGSTEQVDDITRRCWRWRKERICGIWWRSNFWLLLKERKKKSIKKISIKVFEKL